MLRFVCRFPQFSFLIDFIDGVLPPPPPPHPPLRDGGILILKSSNHSGEEIFLSYGRASPYGEHSDNGNQRRGVGDNSGQNN